MYKEVRMPYSEYKKYFSDYRTDSDSYNKKDRSIIVYLPEELDIEACKSQIKEKEVRMHYSQYRKYFSNYRTIEDSYNKADKTVSILLPEELNIEEHKAKIDRENMI